MGQADKYCTCNFFLFDDSSRRLTLKSPSISTGVVLEDSGSNASNNIFSVLIKTCNGTLFFERYIAIMCKFVSTKRRNDLKPPKTI